MKTYKMILALKNFISFQWTGKTKHTGFRFFPFKIQPPNKTKLCFYHACEQSLQNDLANLSIFAGPLLYLTRLECKLETKPTWALYKQDSKQHIPWSNL